MESKLKERIRKVLAEAKDIIQEIQINDLQDEQFALDFLDKLNGLSVMF